MENDLISRSTAIDALLKQPNTPTPSVIRRVLRQVPTVDAVVLPCKIGDTVWAVRRLSGGHLRAFQSVVSEMQFVGSEMRLSITVRGVCRGEWGKTIFATQEEAEEEVKRRNGHGH